MMSFLATATVAVGMLAALPQPVSWEPDYGKALRATRAADRPLLVVLDQPSQPAGVFSQVSLVQETAGAQPQNLGPYQLCHVDVTTEYGQRVAAAFGAKTFPYTAIIDKTGSYVLFSKSGDMDSQQWKTTLAKYQKGERIVPVSTQRTTTVGYRQNSYYGGQTSYYPSYGMGGYGMGGFGMGSSCPSCQRGF